MKYFAHGRYVDFVEYFDFDWKDVKVLILFLFSPAETMRLATWASPKMGSHVSIATSFNVGANSPYTITNV